MPPFSLCGARNNGWQEKGLVIESRPMTHSHIKNLIPLWLRVWLRHDSKHVLWRARQRLKGHPVPPADLIHKTICTRDPRAFVETGADAVAAIREMLGAARVKRPHSVLDFGTGADRLIRHWARTPDLHGCDYNPELVGWCARNLRFAEFRLNPVAGPLPYDDESFDLVYSYSVFTHLPEGMQKAWMAELRRVLKDGGMLYLTLHGEAYAQTLDEWGRAEFRAGRFVCSAGAPGSNDLAAYHPEAYVRGEFSEGFEVAGFRVEGARGGSRQDAWLLRIAN